MSYHVKVNGNVLPELYTEESIRGYAAAWREYRAEVHVAMSGTQAFVPLSRFLGEPPHPPVSAPLPPPNYPPQPAAGFGPLPSRYPAGDTVSRDSGPPAGFVAPFGNTGFRPTIAGAPTTPSHPLQPNRVALVSMILGIIGLLALPLTCGLSLGLSIPAAVLGYLGNRKVRRSPSQFGGTGFAYAGMITGGIGMVIAPVVLAMTVPNALAARRAANQQAALQAIINIGSSQSAYRSGVGRGNFATSLEELDAGKKLAPDTLLLRNRGQMHGYELVKFEVVPGSGNVMPRFQAIIAPVRTIGIWRTGELCYFVNESGVIRQSKAADGLPNEFSNPVDVSFPFDMDHPPPFIVMPPNN